MAKKKRKLTKKQMIVQWIAISIAASFAIYFIVCGIIMGVQLAQMNRQNSTAQNVELGRQRLGAIHSKGIVTDYKIYDDNEIAQAPAKGNVNLYFFPNPTGEISKFVLVCPGGAYTSCSCDGEGFASAAELNLLGYTAFVLEYRVGDNGGDYAALDDVAAALRFICENSQNFNVSTQNYALLGYSAGANLVGLFGTENLGYAQYEGVKKPSAILMGYPWCNLNIKSGNLAKVIMYSVLNGMGYNGFLGKGATAQEKLSMRVSLSVTENYPTTYVMHGTADVLVPNTTHSDVLVASLEANNVNYYYERAQGVNHGCGVGKGTAAENWLARAVAFWEENS